MRREGKQDSLYIVLMYGREQADDPPGTMDRTGSVVLGPFTSLALEYRTKISIAPGQASMTLLGSTGRYIAPEQMAEAIRYYQKHGEWPDTKAEV